VAEGELWHPGVSSDRRLALGARRFAVDAREGACGAGFGAGRIYEDVLRALAMTRGVPYPG